MAQPPLYSRQYDFSDYQDTYPDEPLPGNQVDIELNAVLESLNDTITNLGLIQADDGSLRNESVAPETLDTDTLALISNGLNFIGDWATDIDYIAGDVVRYTDGATYVALISHTSDVFDDDLAAGDWILFANPAGVLGDILFDKFSGNGATTAFTISASLTDEKQVFVFVDGEVQDPSAAYTVSGTTLTFAVAPPAGTGNIMVFGVNMTAIKSATEAAASAAAAESSASAASTSASNASTSATAALAAQAQAEAAASNLTGTSTTSVSIATGSKSFTTQDGKYFNEGAWVLITSDANEANYMHGQVTAYSGTSLTVNVTNTGGSGTETDWTIRVSGTQGATGPTGPSGTISDGDKGDITVSGSGSRWTVDNNTITYAKMQDVSATSRILGRKTAAAGDPEECTLSEILDFIGSAARGDILYRDASSWARLAAGTSGQFLKTQGAGADPTWASQTAGIDLYQATTTSGSTVTFTLTDTYKAIDVFFIGTSSSGSATLTIDLTDDGTNFESTGALNQAGAGNYSGHAVILYTGVAATNKRVECGCAVSSTNYSSGATGFESSHTLTTETGITTKVRISVSTGNFDNGEVILRGHK